MNDKIHKSTQEFKKIYYEVYGEHLSSNKATKYARDLLKFYKLILTTGGCHGKNYSTKS